MGKWPVRKLVLLWSAWFVSIYAFQYIVSERYQPKRPDNVIFWTAGGTTQGIADSRRYVSESWLKRQSAFDSEFYVSIALYGYDDPDARYEWSDNYKERVYDAKAFMPLYPLTMTIVSFPMRLAGMEVITAAKLAGVIISLICTLLAMFALYRIVSLKLREDDALRAVFYFLIFPTGFFLAQIYTEAMFAALAFWSILLAMERRFLPAGLLAAAAVWTRGTGGLLVIPLAWEWLASLNLQKPADILKNLKGKAILPALTLFLPVLSFVAFSVSPIGRDYYHIQKIFFGRTSFSPYTILETIRYLHVSFITNNTKTLVYYFIEYSLVLLALVTSIISLKKHTALALFGIALTLVSFLSGPYQSLSRYVLLVPSIYVVLAQWGRHEAADRGWTIASLLVMGMLTTLFTFKFWVA